MFEKAIEIFQKMPYKPDVVSLTILFNACSKLSNSNAKTIGHIYLEKLTDFHYQNSTLVNSIIDMTMKFGELEKAERIFFNLKNKTLITYGALMQGSYLKLSNQMKTCKTDLGYITNDRPEKALEVFEKLPLKPDRTVYRIPFVACVALDDIERGMKLGNNYFRQMPKELLHDEIILGSILTMLMKFGQVKEAETLFLQSKKKDDRNLWNSHQRI